jgi:hypothetical protein
MCEISISALQAFTSNKIVVGTVTTLIKVGALYRLDWQRANLMIDSYSKPIVEGLYKKFFNP